MKYLVQKINKGTWKENIMLEINGLMPDRYDDFPMSRDHGYEDFKCMSRLCISNRVGKCISPSRCTIGEDGKCEGFKLKKDFEE